MPTASGHTKAIRASEVIGSDIFDKSGNKIGKIEDIILDKTNSHIMFAAVSVGGMVTTSDNYFPLPWASLDYEQNPGGYVVSCTQEQLASGPSDTMKALTKGDGDGPRTAAYTHFKVAKDW